MPSNSTAFFQENVAVAVRLLEFLCNHKCDKNSNSYCTSIRGAEIATQLLTLRMTLFDLGFLSCINNKLYFWVLLFVHQSKRLLHHSVVSEWKEAVSSLHAVNILELFLYKRNIMWPLSHCCNCFINMIIKNLLTKWGDYPSFLCFLIQTGSKEEKLHCIWQHWS